MDDIAHLPLHADLYRIFNELEYCRNRIDSKMIRIDFGGFDSEPERLVGSFFSRRP